ncbi:hypothetical protein HZB05_02935 [Candidatus Wolfebacteria bacterium]|nr:hypothetical protein [Candidatus Wolfebacteria bacterium]
MTRLFNIKLQFKVLIFFGLLFTIYYLLFTSVYARTAPEFMVSWQAQNYVPVWYVGKIFPTNSAKISIRFDLIDNGKIADLLSSTCENTNNSGPHPCRVRWYINDDLRINEDNGFGIKTFSFANTNVYDGNDIEIHISIPNYHGQSLDKIVTIPVKSPELTIEAPYYDRRAGKESRFIAWPFFFNSIMSLSFKWLMDGAEVGENSPFLNLSVDPATLPTTKINLEVQVQNSAGEISNKQIQVEVK